MQLLYSLRGAVWILVYLLFILAPLFALLAGSHPPARDFWTEFSVALGYSGLAMMGLQFGLTARFQYVTEPWGEDVIYHFHRQISLIAVGLVVVHPAILVVVQPQLLAPSNMLDAPLSAYFAFLSIFSVIALVVTALWRLALKIKYETWHLIHVVLAIVAITAGVVHMVGSGFYLVDPWKRTLWIGLTIFWIGLLLYVRIVKPLFMLRRPYIVSEVRRERGDTIDLGDAAGWSPRLPVQPWPVRLADAVGQSVQDYRTPVFILVQRGGRGWACRDVDQEPRRLHQRD